MCSFAMERLIRQEFDCLWIHESTKKTKKINKQENNRISIRKKINQNSKNRYKLLFLLCRFKFRKYFFLTENIWWQEKCML